LRSIAEFTFEQSALLLVGQHHRQQVSEASVAERQRALPPMMWSAPMCEKCVAIDKKVLHYRDIIARVMDHMTTERVNKLIQEMQASKIELHPKE
jgi:hypothetical protein